MQTKHQAYCRYCRLNTLHEREVERPQHVLHFGLTVLCCGWWLPVWIILSLFPKVHPWFCTSCGQSMDDLTPDEIAEQHERRLLRNERLMGIASSTADAAGNVIDVAVDATGKFFRGVFRQLDGIMRRVSGDDGFMYWFFWTLLVGVGTSILVGGIYAAIRLS